MTRQEGGCSAGSNATVTMPARGHREASSFLSVYQPLLSVAELMEFRIRTHRCADKHLAMGVIPGLSLGSHHGHTGTSNRCVKESIGGGGAQTCAKLVGNTLSHTRNMSLV